MGNRLSRIVTRTGDRGQTGLASGGRVSKTHPRVHALGEVDELNSQIGVVLAQKPPRKIADILLRVQHELFNLGGELSMPGSTLIQAGQVEALEADATVLNTRLPPLKEFVLPGGKPAAAQAHLARTVCRRAERSLWVVNESDPLNPETSRYLNRLSDLLFIVARTLARTGGGKEVTWAGTGKRRR